MLQLWAGESYATTAAAFGLITRIMTFLFLPLLGFSFAFQTIVGHNYGAGNAGRVALAVRIALFAALGYCVMAEGLLIASRHSVGAMFVDDAGVIGEVARILPMVIATLFLFGPQMMVATCFQAIGDAPRAGLLGLSRTYLFGLPLTGLLPFLLGEPGIWLAGPVAEICVLA